MAIFKSGAKRSRSGDLKGVTTKKRKVIKIREKQDRDGMPGDEFASKSVSKMVFAGKSERTKKKKKKIRKRRKSKAQKKMTQLVKGIVENVTSGKAAISHYHKIVGWDVRITQDPSAISYEIEKYFLYSLKRGNQRNGSYTEFNGRINPFNVKRLLDAASVLYNNRARGVDVTSATNMFNAQYLKLNIPYYYSKYTLKNFTNETYRVKVHRLTAKSNTDISPEDLWVRQIAVQIWVGGLPAITDVDNSYLRSPHGLKIGSAQSFDKHWSHTVVDDKVMYPGHDLEVVEIHRDATIDFQKYYNDGSPSILSAHAKGENMYWFEIIPLLEGMVVDRPAGNFQMMARVNVGETNSNHGWLGTFEEHYAIEQPEITSDAYQGEKHALFEDVNQNRGTAEIVSDLVPMTRRTAAVTTTAGAAYA